MITESYFAEKRANDHIKPYVLNHKPTTPAVKPLPNTPQLHQREILRATKLGITLDEYAKRDKAIREEFSRCPFSVGEIVAPRNQENYRLYGECRIIGITQNYFEYGGLDDEWDKVLRIITFESVNPLPEQQNKVYHGTVNWFEKAKKC